MAAYSFTISDTPEGSVRIVGVLADREGGNKTPAGHIAQSTMVFLAELQQQLQEGSPITAHGTLQ